MSLKRYIGLEEDEAYARPLYYSSGYREDEELYVYDQGCFNCEFHNSEWCPMYISSTMSQAEIRRRLKRRKEDAEIRNGCPTWCIHWEGRRRNKRR